MIVRALLLLAAAVGPGAPAFAADEVGPGAYCPLPEEGEMPRCLDPGRAEYGEFFSALEVGEPDDAEVAELEEDLARGGESERAYVALSSLAYGYYRLAQQAAATPGEDPKIVARLERWNALLTRAYSRSEDAGYREAVRTAALDLRAKSPAVEIRCLDAAGRTAACQSTEAVLRGLDEAGSRVGIRGALQRILRRITGGES